MVQQKYIAPRSILEWIKDPRKHHPGCSIMWKVVLKSFDLVGNGLAWKVGYGKNIHIGMDP